MMKILPWMYNREIIAGTQPKIRYDCLIPFEEWQSAAREKLSELLGMSKLNKSADNRFTPEYVKENAGYTEHRFTLESEVGYSFPVVMRVPYGIKGKMPVIICLQGHSSGFHISLGEARFKGDEDVIHRDESAFLVRAVKEGFVSVALEQRNYGECGGNTEDGSPLCHVSTMNNILLGRTTIGERVLDVMTVIDALIENFDFIDTKSINLLGHSGGGTAVYYTACLDPRVNLAVVSGAVCTLKDSIASIKHCVCNFVPGIAEYFDTGDLAGMIAPRGLVIVHGKNDPIFPYEGVLRSYEIVEKMYRVAGSDKYRLVSGDDGHKFYADAAWSAINEIMNR